MKLRVLSVLALSAGMFFACGEPTTNEAEEPAAMEEATVEAASYMADVASSSVNWKGEVAGVYGHEGYVNLQSGTLEMMGEAITGGEFVIDMSTVYPTDSASFKDQDGGRITDLQGHLSGDEFFASATYPTAMFVITSVEGTTIKGNLTVRDVTNEETIEVSHLEVSDMGVMASGTMVFNRQTYGVSWVHYMKDMVLSDDISLTFSLVATKG